MFSDISIGIKTFLRDAQLFTAIYGIQKEFPCVKMIIADDGDMTEEKDGIYADLIREGHSVGIFPFDSGFGVKSNWIAMEALRSEYRPYLLTGSDDFDFTAEAARGLDELHSVLYACPNIDVASGRVNNRAYEFNLEEADGVVREIPVKFSSPNNDLWFGGCDLTVNYSLIHTRVFRRVCWDNDVKIGGGEHGAFFLDLKRESFQTVFVPGVNINEQQIRNSARYNQFRQRSRNPDRPCFVKRGIREYILGDGTIDYRRPDAN